MNTYGYVGGNPVRGIDPYGLADNWSVSVEGYYGWGGGVVFGQNPDGGGFITLRLGYGIGGGVSYDPKGVSPGYDCDRNLKDYAAVGLFGGANAALGPGHIGLNGEVGVRTDDFVNYRPYYGGGPTYGASLDGKWGLRLGGAVGAELTYVDAKDIVIADSESCNRCQ